MYTQTQIAYLQHLKFTKVNKTTYVNGDIYIVIDNDCFVIYYLQNSTPKSETCCTFVKAFDFLQELVKVEPEVKPVFCFIWYNVLSQYGPGHIYGFATSLEEVRKLFTESNDKYYLEAFGMEPDLIIPSCSKMMIGYEMGSE